MDLDQAPPALGFSSSEAFSAQVRRAQQLYADDVPFRTGVNSMFAAMLSSEPGISVDGKDASEMKDAPPSLAPQCVLRTAYDFSMERLFAGIVPVRILLDGNNNPWPSVLRFPFYTVVPYYSERMGRLAYCVKRAPSPRGIPSVGVPGPEERSDVELAASAKTGGMQVFGDWVKSHFRRDINPFTQRDVLESLSKTFVVDWDGLYAIYEKIGKGETTMQAAIQDMDRGLIPDVRVVVYDLCIENPIIGIDKVTSLARTMSSFSDWFRAVKNNFSSMQRQALLQVPVVETPEGGGAGKEDRFGTIDFAPGTTLETGFSTSKPRTAEMAYDELSTFMESTRRGFSAPGREEDESAADHVVRVREAYMNWEGRFYEPLPPGGKVSSFTRDESRMNIKDFMETENYQVLDFLGYPINRYASGGEEISRKQRRSTLRSWCYVLQTFLSAIYSVCYSIDPRRLDMIYDSTVRKPLYSEYGNTVATDMERFVKKFQKFLAKADSSSLEEYQNAVVSHPEAMARAVYAELMNGHRAAYNPSSEVVKFTGFNEAEYTKFLEDRRNFIQRTVVDNLPGFRERVRKRGTEELNASPTEDMPGKWARGPAENRRLTRLMGRILKKQKKRKSGSTGKEVVALKGSSVHSDDDDEDEEYEKEVDGRISVIDKLLGRYSSSVQSLPVVQVHIIAGMELPHEEAFRSFSVGAISRTELLRSMRSDSGFVGPTDDPLERKKRAAPGSSSQPRKRARGASGYVREESGGPEVAAIRMEDVLTGKVDGALMMRKVVQEMAEKGKRFQEKLADPSAKGKEKQKKSAKKTKSRIDAAEKAVLSYVPTGIGSQPSDGATYVEHASDVGLEIAAGDYSTAMDDGMELADPLDVARAMMGGEYVEGAMKLCTGTSVMNVKSKQVEKTLIKDKLSRVRQELEAQTQSMQYKMVEKDLEQRFNEQKAELDIKELKLELKLAKEELKKRKDEEKKAMAMAQKDATAEQQPSTETPGQAVATPSGSSPAEKRATPRGPKNPVAGGGGQTKKKK